MNKNIFGDNPVMNFLTTLCDIVILHFLWLLTSIPVFTIGASTTALYYTTMKCIRNGQGGVVKLFFKSFRENFKQASALGLLFLLAGAICAFDLSYAIKAGQNILLIIFTIMTFVFVSCAFYLFPLEAQFENTIKGTIQNSLLMSIKHLPWTLLLLVITVVMLAMAYFSSAILGLMLIIGVGLHAYLCSLVFVHIFNAYMPEEEDKDDADFHIVLPDDKTEDQN